MRIKDPEELTIPPDGKPDREQPRWRRDFPIDWQRDDFVTRRDFTGFMVLTSLAFSVGQIWILIQNFLLKKVGKPPIMSIVDKDKLNVGGIIIFKYPNEYSPRILVRVDENFFVAYDQQCTHLTCPLIPLVETGRLHCPCHEGSFDIRTGEPLAGPPRRTLQRVKLEMRGNTIFAVGLEETRL